MHMDTVEISVSPAVTGRRKEGKVLHVLERGMKQVVCTYQLNKNFGFAVPDNPKFGSDIFIPLERSKGAVNGHKVVVEITQYGKKERIRKEKWWRFSGISMIRGGYPFYCARLRSSGGI